MQHTFRHGYKTKVFEHSPCSFCPPSQSRFPTEVSSGIERVFTARSPSFSTRPFLNSPLWRLVVYSSKVLPPSNASRGILPPVMIEKEDINKQQKTCSTEISMRNRKCAVHLTLVFAKKKKKDAFPGPFGPDGT